jgi:hypothetical protein
MGIIKPAQKFLQFIPLPTEVLLGWVLVRGGSVAPLIIPYCVCVNWQLAAR